MPTIKKLLADEHKAASDYARAATKATKTGRHHVAATLHHIRREEKHHARELTKITDRDENIRSKKEFKNRNTKGIKI